MIRDLKVLGFAVVAMSIAAASASAADFHSESASTGISGSQSTINTFSTHSGSIHCETATFSGSASGSTTSNLIVNPNYSGCQSTGFIKATISVDTNECDYNITDSGAVHLQGCNAAGGIVFTEPFCSITVKQGQTLNSVSFSNSGSGATREVTVSANITNIAYSESGFACRHHSTNTTGGTYTGTILFTGSTGGSHTGIWWTA